MCLVLGNIKEDALLSKFSLESSEIFFQYLEAEIPDDLFQFDAAILGINREHMLNCWLKDGCICVVVREKVHNGESRSKIRGYGSFKDIGTTWLLGSVVCDSMDEIGQPLLAELLKQASSQQPGKPVFAFTRIHHDSKFSTMYENFGLKRKSEFPIYLTKGFVRPHVNYQLAVMAPALVPW